jgi:hypothetical protein
MTTGDTPMAHAVGSSRHGDAVDWLGLVRSEYREMPGLHLTLAQAQRLWCLDAATSSAVFNALVESKFLRHTDRGAFVRADAN